MSEELSKYLHPGPLPSRERVETERLLNWYCDLTAAQYEDLLAISSGQWFGTIPLSRPIRSTRLIWSMP